MEQTQRCITDATATVAGRALATFAARKPWMAMVGLYVLSTFGITTVNHSRRPPEAPSTG
ncbi:MAG: hypothetical protein AAGA17_15935 [Actinomycetota bacterium]